MAGNSILKNIGHGATKNKNKKERKAAPAKSLCGNNIDRSFLNLQH